MLTKRQNLIEVMNGGNPDRFVNQYEPFALVMGVPGSAFRRVMPGGGPVKDGWGVTKEWPLGTPGSFPLHDEEHLVCKDITAVYAIFGICIVCFIVNFIKVNT